MVEYSIKNNTAVIGAAVCRLFSSYVAHCYFADNRLQLKTWCESEIMFAVGSKVDLGKSRLPVENVSAFKW